MAEQNVIDFEQTDELLDSMDAAIAELRSKASRFRGVIESAAEVPSSERQILLSRLSIDTAYAVESAIFSVLRLRESSDGAGKVSDHAINDELKRIRQYYAKVKEAEASQKRKRDEEDGTSSQRKLDVQAAVRFIANDIDAPRDVRDKIRKSGQ